MENVSSQISNLLQKMTSNDKDFRFMATNDLIAELQKDIKLDEISERRIVRLVLRLLEDKNNEVQNLAVKCLGPLVNKVKQAQVEVIVDFLCNSMLSDKEQLRDISSIGLKIVINELPLSNSLASNICKRFTGRLCTAIGKQEDISVQLEALDILADLLCRFGSSLITFHTVILSTLLRQLRSTRQAVRKRTIVALSQLVSCCNQTLYDKLIDYLLEGLSANVNIHTTIQCTATICKQAGHKFGEHIYEMFPLIIQYTRENDDELKEYCLQSFEIFVLNCPTEITPHINTITNLCLEYITYDPNYNYDDDMEEEECSMETEDDPGDEDNCEYSDDDDMSWKVRRSAAKCLEAVISSREELIPDFYRTISPALVARFKEREENVKCDIFHAYIALLKRTMSIEMLQVEIPAVVTALQAQITGKNVKTRQHCFNLLQELVAVLPGSMTDHMPVVITGIQYSLADKNSSNLKIDTLRFINCLLSSHPPEVFYPHLGALIASVINAVNDSFYKTSSEALLVLQELVKIIRPDDPPEEYDFTEFIVDLYSCTLTRLKVSDIDQEVKERAISCMAQIICVLGDFLENELQTCLPIFLDRLRNEMTRLPTLKALTKIAASSVRVNLPIMDEALPILGKLLRQNQRAIKINTLTLLDTLIQNYSQYMYTDLLINVLYEVPPLLSDADLHIAQLTLNFLTSVATTYSGALVDVSNTILPKILVLVTSPLLQGAALEAILNFFKGLVGCCLPELRYHNILKMLVDPVTNNLLHKQAYHTLAKCIAAITVVSQREALPVVEQFLQEIINAKDVTQHMFAILVIGEIGRQVDLSKITNLKEVVLDSFTNSSEDVRSAASYTLGSMSIGNLPAYLPFVLQVIEEQPKYLLFQSLKEIVSSEDVEQLQPFVAAIWTILFKNCEWNEEGTRNVVAECLGRLTLNDPRILLPKLQQSLASSSALVRTTVVTAVKFTISDQPLHIDPILSKCIGRFLETLQDPDENVRRIAIVTFNSAAHKKPALIKDLLDTILPQLYNETKLKKNLIREVKMGPFTHTVDDGLDLRKAAFECMNTLLDTCLDQLDLQDFLNHLETGLKDHYDIKIITYLMVARLAQLRPTEVLQRLDSLVKQLKETCIKKVKSRENYVKQEYEKQQELKRSAMKVVAALLTIPGSDENCNLTEFVFLIKSATDLRPIFESIPKDTTGLLDCFLTDQS